MQRTSIVLLAGLLATLPLIGGASKAQQNSSPLYTVIKIADGDTITVLGANSQKIKVRFACVDTAEVPHTKKEQQSRSPRDLNQFQWGRRAQSRLTQLLSQSKNKVNLKITDTDRYGRKIAEVRLSNGTLVQQALAREGLAMVYRKYISTCPSARIVEVAEAQAKQQQAGVWSDPKFVPPWQYRQR